MTHDPLCPYEPERRTPCTHGLDENGFATIESITTDMCQGERHYWPGVPCECDLIAEVRADEQQQVASRLTAYHAEGCIGGVSNLGCGCGLWNDVVTYSVELP